MAGVAALAGVAASAGAAVLAGEAAWAGAADPCSDAFGENGIGAAGASTAYGAY